MLRSQHVGLRVFSPSLAVRQYGLTRSIEGSGVTDEDSREEEVCLLLSWVAHWGAPSHMQSARGRLAAKSEEADHE
jgi:hypothetical protein